VLSKAFYRADELTEKGGIVLSGRLEVTVESERRILGPGDAYYFESPAAPLPLHRRRAVRSDQRRHAAVILNSGHHQ
jgi:quercetin dioxygenase-like cupin family protein